MVSKSMKLLQHIARLYKMSNMENKITRDRSCVQGWTFFYIWYNIFFILRNTDPINRTLSPMVVFVDEKPYLHVLISTSNLVNTWMSICISTNLYRSMMCASKSNLVLPNRLTCTRTTRTVWRQFNRRQSLRVKIFNVSFAQIHHTNGQMPRSYICSYSRFCFHVTVRPF